jgi:hypothetical protein
MLEFTINTGDLSRQLSELPGELLDSQKELMEEVGLYLVSECKLDFEKKSRRGTSLNIRWKELAESTERQKARRGGWKGKPDEKPPASQIGVDKGLLRNSQQPGFAASGGRDVFETRQDSVTVGYGMEYAKYFDEKRTLIPDPAPKEWIDECEAIVSDWLEEELQKRLQ